MLRPFAGLLCLVQGALGFNFLFNSKNNNNVEFAKFFKKSVTPFITATAIISSSYAPSLPAFADDWTRLADVGLKEFLVKDGRQFIRLALPTVNSKKELVLGAKRQDDAENIQESLELVRLRLEQVGVTNPMVWGNLAADEGNAETLFKKKQNDLINAAVNPSEASAFIQDTLQPDFNRLKAAVQVKDGKSTFEFAESTAADFAQLRLMQIKKGGDVLPYKIPDDYKSLTHLDGLATVEMKITSKKGFKIPDSFKVVPDMTFLITVDGFHAPLTAGNFIDLVDKKFYDNMMIQKAEELVVQTGKPNKQVDGYTDPATGSIRTIPLELFYKNDAAPVYGITSDDDNRATETMALPFQAFGAVGMARENDQEDSASSQFFFLKWKQALNPPGRNTLDGFYNCFGYVTSPNEDFLGQLTLDDKIDYIKVVSGIENLKRP